FGLRTVSHFAHINVLVRLATLEGLPLQEVSPLMGGGLLLLRYVLLGVGGRALRCLRAPETTALAQLSLFGFTKPPGSSWRMALALNQTRCGLPSTQMVRFCKLGLTVRL